MYRLVRSKNGFELVKQPLATPFDRQFQISDPLTEHLPLDLETPRVNRRIWQDFVKNGRFSQPGVCDTILESWKRCFEAEVKFSGGKCEDILPEGELARRQDQLAELAFPIMETLYGCIRGAGFILVLVDRDGYVLKSLGDVKTLRRAENLRFGPGANWSEYSVGTNAIGTALTIGRGIQVTGAEHYNDGHHTWTCTAAPIFSASGEIIGGLDISGPRERSHVLTMGMVAAGVKAIEEHLRLEQSHANLAKAGRYIHTALNSVSEGVISLDSQGKINAVNLPAAQMIGKLPRDIMGKSPREALDIRETPEDMDGRRDTPPVEIALNTRHGKIKCLASARSVLDEAGNHTGSLITLSKLPEYSPSSVAGDEVHAIRYTFRDIVGQCSIIRECVEKARMAANSPSTVLILGESGTGKEIFAHAIHSESDRRHGPFVSMNCGAIPRELIQSELFGYSDGAFTGARRGGRKGKLETAAGGTLFLDEIADMPLDMQINLLRVLEDKTVFPVGGGRQVKTDVRIIAATNRSLYGEVQAGNFREDLFYRLNVVVLEIPPLRERRSDICLLADYYIEKLAVEMHRYVDHVDPRFMEALQAYHWPGNVRELVNVIEQAMNFFQGAQLRLHHLPEYIRQIKQGPSPMETDDILPLSTLEKYAIEHALDRCRGNISRVASALGIGRNTLYDKMRKYGISSGGTPNRPGRAPLQHP